MRAALPAAVLALVLTGCTSASAPVEQTARPATTPAPASPSPSSSPTVDPALVQQRLVAFPEDFRATAESVYDAVQPLHDAFAAFATPREENAQVRDDVLAAGGAADALRARVRELTLAAEAPGAGVQLRTRVAALVAALEQLVQAAATLEQAATVGGSGTLPALVQGEQALRAGTDAWREAITPVYAGRPPERGLPTLPAPERGDLRAPESKGGWLLAAGRACGAAADPQAAAAAVLQVPVPPREEAVLRPTVLQPLDRVRTASGDDLRAARVAATAGLARYGATTCVTRVRVSEG